MIQDLGIVIIKSVKPCRKKKGKEEIMARHTVDIQFVQFDLDAFVGSASKEGFPDAFHDSGRRRRELRREFCGIHLACLPIGFV
jgi:hypothetical protein